MNSKKRIHRIDVLLIAGIYLSVLGLVAIWTHGEYLYGSKLDWASQHAVFPEYFRDLFYETGDFLPSLAPNIGAGQNIFFISYYGILSPFLLLSYLFPFIPMIIYMQVISILGVLFSILLFYLWVGKRFDRNVTLFLSIMLAFSGPLIFHSHRHLMFVNYMPFLIASLHCVDLFFEKGRKSGLAVCVALMIFTSYFFSVSAIVCVTIYAVCRFLEGRERISETERPPFLPDFAKTGGIFAAVICIGILIAGVLLLPTLKVMLGGRDSTNLSIGWKDLLPTVNLSEMTFGTYCLGLSSLVIFSIVDQILYGKKSERFLAICFAVCLTCPAVLFLLNGMQYLDGKVLIAFLPVAALFCGRTLVRILDGKIVFRWEIPIFWALSAVGLLLSSGRTFRIRYGVDVVVLTVGIYLLPRITRKLVKEIASLLLLVPTVGSCISLNGSENWYSVNDYEKETSEDLYALMALLEERDSGFYRTAVNLNASDTPNRIYGMNHYSDTIYSSLHDGDYSAFYFEEMLNENSYRNRALMTRSKNIYFDLYMGNKYWVTTEIGYVPEGYTQIASVGDYVAYENENCLPIGYVSNRLMSLREYETLTYPNNIEALVKYTVVDKDLPDTGFSGSAVRMDASDIFENCPFFGYTEDGYRTAFSYDAPEMAQYVNADGYAVYTVTMPEECVGKTIFLRFQVDNTVGKKSEDVKIWVNGVANKLTAADWKYYNHNSSFEYVITGQGKQGRKITFKFPKGEYSVDDLEIYCVNSESVWEEALQVDAFDADMEQTSGDEICGTVHATSDGYFNLSFVYSEGYRVYLDGEEVQPEQVDTCFLGFPISSGDHEIRIVFRSPGLREGLVFSAFGGVGLAVLVFLDLHLEHKQRKFLKTLGG